MDGCTRTYKQTEHYSLLVFLKCFSYMLLIYKEIDTFSMLQCHQRTFKRLSRNRYFIVLRKISQKLRHYDDLLLQFLKNLCTPAVIAMNKVVA